MGVASLVLGIISIILSLFPFCRLVGGILGIIGIILGAVGKKKQESSGIATAGLACSIVGTILSLAFYVACVACVSSFESVL